MAAAHAGHAHACPPLDFLAMHGKCITCTCLAQQALLYHPPCSMQKAALGSLGCAPGCAWVCQPSLLHLQCASAGAYSPVAAHTGGCSVHSLRLGSRLAHHPWQDQRCADLTMLSPNLRIQSRLSISGLSWLTLPLQHASSCFEWTFPLHMPACNSLAGTRVCCGLSLVQLTACAFLQDAVEASESGEGW